MLGAVMTVLSTLALVARLYARRIRDVGLGWDDWFMFAAWVGIDVISLCMDVDGLMTRYSQ